VLTGVSNATAESLNRIAKLEARQAYSFRNPATSAAGSAPPAPAAAAGHLPRLAQPAPEAHANGTRLAIGHRPESGRSGRSVREGRRYVSAGR